MRPKSGEYFQLFFHSINQLKLFLSLKAMSLHSVRDEDPTIRSKLLNRINAENIRKTVREFSSESHRAGSQNDLNLALRVKQFFIDYNFDKTEIKDYSVLLSVTDDKEPNYFELIDEMSNKTIYSSLSSDSLNNSFCAYSQNIDIKVSFANIYD